MSVTVLPKNLFSEDTLSSDDGVKSSLTYDLESGRQIDDSEAMIQAIKKVLITESGDSEYYLGDYGIILEDLIGASPSVVEGVLSSRVKEALLLDDRIDDVKDFKITRTGSEMNCSFTVVSVFGNLEGDVSVTTG